MSPPEGMAEPGHPRSTVYPLLYRHGEQVEPRYLHGSPSPSWGAQDSGPCPPAASIHHCAAGGLAGALGCSRGASDPLNKVKI